MVHEETVSNAQTEFIERLFRDNYMELLRYAKIVLARCGASTVSVEGRAEDVVQEAFGLAWQKLDEVSNGASPIGWMYKTVYYKAHEAVREDLVWQKRLALLPPNSEAVLEIEDAPELTEHIQTEEYDLLWKIYQEGYSYKEVCDELGIKKSALAMRIRRAKEKLKKKLEIIENE